MEEVAKILEPGAKVKPLRCLVDDLVDAPIAPMTEASVAQVPLYNKRIYTLQLGVRSRACGKFFWGKNHREGLRVSGGGGGERIHDLAASAPLRLTAFFERGLEHPLHVP
jgi:hypothetical protein